MLERPLTIFEKSHEPQCPTTYLAEKSRQAEMRRTLCFAYKSAKTNLVIRHLSLVTSH